MAKKLKITLKKSIIGQNEQQRGTVAALGLRKLHQSVVKEDTPNIRGMAENVNHLVVVEEIEV
ncbi:50S ribosomal protein L30 [Metallumcola ferriviriculae]|uniref:Large ribosomal subunit protein uL30 n=1 Tax=Metallumcola ferriviriculae TaxID=3039180 RepID=A0AAU0UJL4_9FIRM|nr:50S ribosomal protein L30 [Desulfitibacteraceae bacterium MK1]